MPTFQKFEDIEAWQKARELTREIYRISSDGVFSRDFGLRDQMRRASVSVMSNIAEGFERCGTGELMQFLSMAKGSAGEIKSQLYVAHDQKYIDRESFDKLFNSACEISKMINGLMNYIRSSQIKGIKYKRTDAADA
jgi:four helix bundle protein